MYLPIYLRTYIRIYLLREKTPVCVVGMDFRCVGHVNVIADSLESHASATPLELTVQEQCSNARTLLTIQVKYTTVGDDYNSNCIL